MLDIAGIRNADHHRTCEALRNQIPVHGFVRWLCEWVYFKNSLRMKQINDRLRYVVLRGIHVTILR